MGLPATGNIDEAFVRGAADWQEARLETAPGDGAVGPRTEAHLHILLSEAEHAVQAAQRMLAQGGFLYDGWANDMRDNDCNGLADAQDPHERAVPDNVHYSQVCTQFRLCAGIYVGGWNFERAITIHADQLITGNFRYHNCADIISDAYRSAGVMPHYRQTEQILNVFRQTGFVWKRSERYPDQYLPGDFICTLRPGHGGHSGIVVQPDPTRGGANAPMVIDLPGPSSQVTDGSYNPASTNDLQLHRWPSFRINDVEPKYQFLGRLLHSRLRGSH
jgi:hypothetical protein